MKTRLTEVVNCNFTVDPFRAKKVDWPDCPCTEGNTKYKQATPLTK